MLAINNLARKAALYRQDVLDAVARVLDRGWFVLGPELEQFEQRFAAYIGSDHCVGVANGTEALGLALQAAGLQARDTVATVANAGMYTALAALGINVHPLFMDVDLDNQLVNLNEVAQAIERGAKAVVITHLYGRIVPEIQEIADYCATQNVPLIEDCAQAHGAKLYEKSAGTFGDMSCFSFYPTKNLGCFGDGGAVLTNNSELARKLKTLRQYGWGSKYRVEHPGGRNSRLDEIQAAILNTLLPGLAADNAARLAIAQKYSSGICHNLIFTPSTPQEGYVAHLYVIRTTKRQELQTYMHSKGIATEVHYPVPDHQQPILQTPYAHILLPNTQILSEQILTLPCYPEMAANEVQYVIDTINSWSV